MISIVPATYALEATGSTALLGLTMSEIVLNDSQTYNCANEEQ
ncbi:hypothetical protein [Burkholderia vietnamiensis]|jgi:hypothetical protein|nr:hypothetical protein [Burkholderia vietnamiensis]CAG9233119.1 hypothetical protein BVI434_850094 [Burkholderia vietnamiensis]